MLQEREILQATRGPSCRKPDGTAGFPTKPFGVPRVGASDHSHMVAWGARALLGWNPAVVIRRIVRHLQSKAVARARVACRRPEPPRHTAAHPARARHGCGRAGHGQLRSRAPG
jgi:hypothetical protein